MTSDAEHPEAQAAWSSCFVALQRMCEVAPFGDAPSASEAPYSATQLLRWGRYCIAESKDGHDDTKHRVPSAAELQLAAKETLLRVEAFNRSSLERELSSIQFLASTQPLVAKLPPQLIEQLLLRCGPETIARHLGEPKSKSPREQATSAALSTETVDVLFAPLARLATQAASWRYLLQEGGAAPLVGLALSDQSPSTLQGLRSLRLSASICSSIQPVGCLCHTNGLPCSPSVHIQVEIRLFYPAAMPKLDDGPAMTQRVHRIFVAERLPAEQLRVSSSEDGSDGSQAASATMLPAMDATKPRTGSKMTTLEQVVDCIKRYEIVFDPPAELHRPGDFLVYTLKLPVVVGGEEALPPVFELRHVEATALARN